MANRSVVGIVSAASKQIVNDFWEFGLLRGPYTFSVPLSPSGEMPATFFGMHDASATDEDAAMWQALTDGVLPDGIAYGTGSIPAAQDLIDACDPANLVISSKAGGVMSATEHFNGVLAGMGLLWVNEM